ncbi:predicted protein [Uncinocarpus reesii 1704]|uniref:Major facilitator superfamily (MFS) profile domain-containing protein n=1 Tax=Uncinocarpus reesii (strain UAMH 1704) TaxID=336963 RepID=C4JHK5_UNCRE|nr:uncharacterized protein UREG_01368 [Uncinocarpus reesii 1704]EEP76519.1 predicted protein [Uncinocarpus reesii 1704]
MDENGPSGRNIEPKPNGNLENGVEPAENDKEESPRQLHGIKWAIAYISMLSTTFLFALDNTVVADIQPAILEDFGEIELLPWIGTGFALGSMCILPWGKAYGVFDLKVVYLLNVVVFEIGSAVCGAAPNMTAMIIARVVAGIGGSGMYSGTMTYVSMTTSMKERAMYMSGNAVMWGLGSVLGPVVGGAFAISSATWRWAFYINLVIGALFAPSYLFLLPRIDPRPGKSLREKLRMIDWISSVVFLGGCACFTMAISFGGAVYAWSSGPEITLWVMTAVLLIITILLSFFHPGVTKENRLYPAHFLKRPILINMQLQIFLSSGFILSMTYYIPLFFQFLRTDGPLDAGVRLLPFIVSMVVLSLLNGALMPKLAYIGPWHIVGSALAVIGSALMYTVNEHTSNANIYGYTVLVGAGGGCYIVAGFAIVQSLVPVHDIPNAVGALTICKIPASTTFSPYLDTNFDYPQTGQDLGMVTFLAVGGALFQNFALKNVKQALPALSRTEIKDLIAGTSSHAFKSLSDEDKVRVIPQIASAMRSVWLLFLAGAVISFILSVTLAVSRLFPFVRLSLHA